MSPTDRSLVWSFGREILLQQIGKHGQRRICHRRTRTEFSLLLGLQAHLPHQTLDPFTVDTMPQFTHFLGDAGHPVIPMMLLEYAADYLGKAIIQNQAPRVGASSPRVVARSRDIQHATLDVDPPLIRMRENKVVPHAFSFVKYAAASF